MTQEHIQKQTHSRANAGVATGYAGLIHIPVLLALLFLTFASVVYADPPGRVARLSVLSGDIGFLPAGDDKWRDASLNRPLVVGDRLYTEADARTELDLGSAALRLDENSEVRVLNLDDDFAQIELTEGTLNLSVRRAYEGQQYEIDTPTLALVVDAPGEFRIDVDARAGTTQISVINGQAKVYGERDASQRVSAGQSYLFHDTRLRDYEVFNLPRRDDFDAWTQARDDRYRNSQARRYVSPDMIGYADLDDYGDWREERSYGPVWYPRRVDRSWAPYRDGHWAWVDPWGWTWVDNAPWGFAPSHYGRWVYVGSRWGWMPGPIAMRPVYAPALVAFIGGSNWSIGISHGVSPIGWYPLGPRDVYMPSYRVSRRYFSDVNVTNIHQHTVINQTIINNYYNDYSSGRPAHKQRHAYRDEPAAVTAMNREDFVQARAVNKSRLKLGRDQLRQAEVVTTPSLVPTEQSIAPVQDKARKHRRDRHTEPVDVVTRNQPAPQVKSLRERLPEIEREVRRNNRDAGGENAADAPVVREDRPSKRQRRDVEASTTPSADTDVLQAGDDVQRPGRGLTEQKSDRTSATEMAPAYMRKADKRERREASEPEPMQTPVSAEDSTAPASSRFAPREGKRRDTGGSELRRESIPPTRSQQGIPKSERENARRPVQEAAPQDDAMPADAEDLPMERRGRGRDAEPAPRSDAKPRRDRMDSEVRAQSDIQITSSSSRYAPRKNEPREARRAEERYPPARREQIEERARSVPMVADNQRSDSQPPAEVRRSDRRARESVYMGSREHGVERQQSSPPPRRIDREVVMQEQAMVKSEPMQSQREVRRAERGERKRRQDELPPDEVVSSEMAPATAP